MVQFRTRNAGRTTWKMSCRTKTFFIRHKLKRGPLEERGNERSAKAGTIFGMNPLCCVLKTTRWRASKGTGVCGCCGGAVGTGADWGLSKAAAVGEESRPMGIHAWGLIPGVVARRG